MVAGMRDSEEITSRSITREELHRLVWETPIPELAAKFGVRSKRLIAICEELNVPYPRALYWRRKRANQRVIIFQLPKQSQGTPTHAFIAAKNSGELIRKDRISEEVPHAQNATAARKKYEGPHPIIAAWHAERNHLRENFFVRDWRSCELRGHQILSRIFWVVEENGFVVRASERAATFCFVFETEKVNCSLREKRRRVREKRQSSGRFSVDLQPSGDLVFKIESHFGPEFSIRREWNETTTQRLEGMIDDIISSVLKAGPALVKLRQQREEATQKYHEKDRLRAAQEALQRTDAKQWEAFVEFAEQLEKIAQARKLLEALERQTGDPNASIGDKTVSQWIDWARAHLLALDPLTSGATVIFSKIAKTAN